MNKKSKNKEKGGAKAPPGKKEGGAKAPPGKNEGGVTIILEGKNKKNQAYKDKPRKKYASQQKPLLGSSKPERRVRGIIANMILRGRDGRSFGKLFRQPLKTVEYVASWVIRLMGSIIFGRSKRKSAGMPLNVVVLMTMALCVLGINVSVKKARTGYVVTTGSEELQVSDSKFQVNNITCHFRGDDIGNSLETKSTESCIVPINQAHPSYSRCWCTSGTVRLSVALGNVIHRRKRSIVEHPEDKITGGIPWVQDRFQYKDFWKLETWYFNNIWLVLFVASVVFFTTRSKVKTGAVIMFMGTVGVAYGDGACLEVEERDILWSPSSTTWLDVVLEQGRCLVVRGENKPLLSFKLGTVVMLDLELDKEFATDCKLVEISSEDRCPSTADAVSDFKGQTNWTCKSGRSHRGWGDGCGLFGLGSVITCVNLDCGKETLELYNYNPRALEYNVEYAVETGSDTTGLSGNITFHESDFEKTVTLDSYGELTINCQVKPFLDYTGHQLLHFTGEGITHTVANSWVEDLTLPWRHLEGEWKDLYAMLVWGEVTPTAISVGVLNDQTGAVQNALHGSHVLEGFSNQTISLKGEKLGCRVHFDKIKVKGRHTKQCIGDAETLGEFTSNTHGTVVVRVRYTGDDVPCKLRGSISRNSDRNTGDGGYFLTTYVVEQDQQEVTLEMVVYPGESWISIQNEKRFYLQSGSSVQNTFIAVYDGLERFVRQGPMNWQYGSVGDVAAGIPKVLHTWIQGAIQTIFGGTSTTYMLILGVFVIWYGTMQRTPVTKLAFYGVGFTILAGNVGVLGNSVGCAIDLERISLKCGINGEFVWQELQNSLFTPQYMCKDDQAYGWVSSLIKQDRIVCIASRGVMESEFMRQVFTDLEEMKENEVTYKTTRIKGRSVMLWGPDEEKVNTTDFIADRTYIGRKYNMAKNLFSSQKEHKTQLISLETSHPFVWDGTCTDVRTFKLNLEHYTYGLMGRETAYVSLAPDEDNLCSKAFASAVAKNQRIIHADNAMWMDSYEKDDLLEIHEISLQEYRECEWSSFYTVYKHEGSETELFMPRTLGGPNSAANQIHGYAVQVQGPWHLTPLTVTRGECPGTNVVISKSCDKRGPSVKAKTKGGKIIKDWCCRSCSLPPVKFETAEGCWYAMEVRPMQPLTTANAVNPLIAPHGKETKEEVETRAQVVWHQHTTKGERIEVYEEDWAPYKTNGDHSFKKPLVNIWGAEGTVVPTQLGANAQSVKEITKDINQNLRALAEFATESVNRMEEIGASLANQMMVLQDDMKVRVKELGMALLRVDTKQNEAVHERKIIMATVAQGFNITEENCNHTNETFDNETLYRIERSVNEIAENRGGTNTTYGEKLLEKILRTLQHLNY